MSNAIKRQIYPSYFYLLGISCFILFVVLMLFIAPYVLAGVPDGNGPWADEVVSFNQANTKSGLPVSTVNPDRSHPEAALGEAEETIVDTNFVSLGFGGTITLKFENGISDGVFVVESTHPNYPLEKAQVELSEDGSLWYLAGSVIQDGQVNTPPQIGCVRYARITDISDPDEFVEDTADGYDVDGVRAEGINCAASASPSPIPTPTPNSESSDGIGGTNVTQNLAPSCSAQKPAAPTLTSVIKVNPATVEVNWTAVSPVTHYTLVYGTSAGNYLYGVADMGNTTSFTVGSLNPGLIYYFAVYAVNDCTPSDLSNELSTGGQGTTGGQVLGATTSVLGTTGSFTYVVDMLVSMVAIASALLFSIRLHRP